MSFITLLILIALILLVVNVLFERYAPEWLKRYVAWFLRALRPPR